MAKKQSRAKKTTSNSKKAHLSYKRYLVVLAMSMMVFGILATQIKTITPISASSSVLGDEDEQEREDEDHEDEKEKEEENENEDEKDDEEEKEDEREDERSSESRSGRSTDDERPRSTSPIGGLSGKTKKETSFERKVITRENEQGLIQKIEYEEENESEDESEDENENEVDDKSESETRLKRKFDMRTTDGQRIRTEIDGENKAKIEIKGAKYSYKYELENGVLKIKVKTEDGEDVEVADEAELELEKSVADDLSEEGIELGEDDDVHTIASHGKKTRTHFPISVDPVTHQLIVTTPSGTKTLSVLPDTAFNNLFEIGIINENDDLASDDTELVEKDDTVVYKISGEKTHKFLGLFSINLPRSAYVSAESGEPLEIEQSLFSRFIDVLSTD